MSSECRLTAPLTEFCAKGMRFAGGWDTTETPIVRLTAENCIFEGEIALALRDFGILALQNCTFEFGICGLWLLEPRAEQLSHAQLEGLRFVTDPEHCAEGDFRYIQCDNLWLNADTGLIPLPDAIFDGAPFAVSPNAILIQTRYLQSVNAECQP